MLQKPQKVTGQSDRPDGMVDRRDNFVIWVKTWSQVIDECRGRLRFFRDKLDLMASREEGLAHLRRVYSKHLPDPKQKGEPAKAATSVSTPRSGSRGSHGG